MKKHLSLILGVALIFLIIPGSIFGGMVLFNILASNGLVSVNDNYTGGTLLGEYGDPANDLLMPVPGSLAKAITPNSLDIISFSARLVYFPFPSGQGIENRLNLVAGFNGEFTKTADIENGLSINVIHFYIDSPLAASAEPVVSERMAHVSFAPYSWDYEVVVDGYHQQARIYDTKGELAGMSSAVYVRQETEPTAGIEQKKWPVKKTFVIAAIPLKLLGEVRKGEWHYYALTGIADSLSPSFLLHAGPDGNNVFDIAGPSGSEGALPVIQPLIIKDGKMR